MRLVTLFFLSSAVLGSAAAAANRPAPIPPQLMTSVQTALHSMIPPGQANQKADRGQGDEHASLRAITVVCSHDNPSATRSAICPTPISPD
jgi:hypothetical protein